MALNQFSIKTVYRCDRCGHTSDYKPTICPKCGVRTNYIIHTVGKVITK